MSSFIDNSYHFIRNHIEDILLVALGIFIFTIIQIKVKDSDNSVTINDKPVLNRKIKEIVIEGLNNKKDSIFDKIMKETTQDFCKKLQGKSHLIEEQCNKQSDRRCKTRSCCVLVNSNNKNKCVSGSKSGPTFHTDDNGNNINFDYYYYQNKCYGNC